MKKSVLVIGGAGRFGSRVAAALAGKDFQVVTFDSLISGDSARVLHGPLVKADAREVPRLVRSFKEYSIQHVYHCGLAQDSGDSLKVYDDHLSGVLSLVQAMREARVKKATVFFASSRTSEMIHRILADCAAAYDLDLRAAGDLTDDSAVGLAIHRLN